tara:strand:- start:143 stop:355 length:213 start_codon:yes stop_codon:yes gene_type:complete
MGKAKINIQMESDSHGCSSSSVEEEGDAVSLMALFCQNFEKSNSFYEIVKASIEAYPRIKAMKEASRNQN